MKYISIFIISFYISLFPQQVSEKFSSAMVAYNSGQYAEASLLFEEFFKEYKIVDEVYASAKYYSAESLLKLGRKNEAAVTFAYLIDNFHWSNFREDALYNIGLVYFSLKNYENSRIRFKQLLNEYPESKYTGSALYWIGESYTAENKTDEAIKFLEEAVNDKRNNRFADYSLYTLASTYEQRGDYQNAVKYYDQLLSYHPNSKLAPVAQIRIGMAYFKLKDYQASILELNNPMLKTLPEDLYSESLYLLANSYYRVQEYQNAEKTYSEIISEFPSSKFFRSANYGLAWSMFQQKKYNDAFRVFDFLSQGADSIAEKSFYWKGECKRYLGKNSEAFEIYKNFIDRYPRSPLVQEVQYQMGVLYYTANNPDLAVRYLLAANSSESFEVRAKALTMLGEIELNKKQFKSASNYFESALEVNSVSEETRNRAKLGLAIAKHHLGDYKNSLKLLSEIEASDASFENQKVNFYFAENYFAEGKYKEALNRYTYAEGKDERFNSMSVYGKAYCYFNSGDYENAAAVFSDFIRKFKNDSRIDDARLRLADSYYGSKNFEAASKIYEDIFKSGARDSDNPYTRYQYAQALYKSGKTEQAIQEFNNIQLKFPNSEYAEGSLFTVGWIYFQRGSYNEAISKYKEMFTKYPNSSLIPMIYYSIGDAYFNMGKYDSALVNYEKVIAQYPNSPNVFDAVTGIQYTYLAKDQIDKAVQFIDNFVNRNPNLSFSDQVFFKKGEIYYSQGDYEKSKIAFKEFIVRYTNSKLVPDAYYWLGKSAQNLNQNEEAIISFEKVFRDYRTSEFAASSVLEMGAVYRNIKDYVNALRIYEAGIKDLPKSSKLPEMLFNKGLTLIEMQKIQEAYQVLDNLATTYPDNIFADKARLELGLIELSASRYENADMYLSYLGKARTDDIGAKAQYYYGLSLFEQKKYNDAITALLRVRNFFSRYEEWVTRSFLLLGDCYVKINDKRSAEEMYRAVLAKYAGTSFGKEAQEKLRKLR